MKEVEEVVVAVPPPKSKKAPSIPTSPVTPLSSPADERMPSRISLSVQTKL